jgi:tRNA nucleotidyltransferase/poly(A) polymerase
LEIGNWKLEIFRLIDPHGEQKDIKKKLIRAVGNPNERFQEDALRMIRAVRIATQLGFTIEEKTFQAIKDNIDLINHISAERIRDELLKLLSYPYAADGYMVLRNSGLAQKILPEVERGFGVEQKSTRAASSLGCWYPQCLIT